MEQWSSLSNTINYIQYDKHPKNFHNLSISAVNVYKMVQLQRTRKVW